MGKRLYFRTHPSKVALGPGTPKLVELDPVVNSVALLHCVAGRPLIVTVAEAVLCKDPVEAVT